MADTTQEGIIFSLFPSQPLVDLPHILSVCCTAIVPKIHNRIQWFMLLYSYLILSSLIMTVVIVDTDVIL